MKKLLLMFSAPLEIVKIIARHEPAYIFWSLPQIIINSILPLLYVYAPKLIIEKLTDGSVYSRVAAVILVYCGILLIMNILNKFLSGRSGLAADKFTRKLRFKIGRIAMQLEIKNIESASQRDVIGMAEKAAGLTETMGSIQIIIANIITITGLAYIVIQLNYLFILLVAITLSAKIIFTCFHYSYNKKMRKLYEENNRVGNYLAGIAYFSEGGAKEIRVNSLQDWFMDKIKYYRNKMVGMQYKDFRRHALFEVITSIIMTGQSFAVLFILSLRYIDGTVSIADFTMYFSTVALLTLSLSAITEQIESYSRQVLNVKDYRKVIDIQMSENHGVCSETVHVGMPSTIDIIFNNVSFIYPGTDGKVLENINIRITDREKLVIVGKNGAGKTTFIKLLCKFYRPTSGSITLNGIDIWSISNEEYFRIISVVFQDYANFAFSLIQNIAMSGKAETKRVSEILKGLGMSGFLDNLPDGLDTCITKNFSQSGIELSGGEGQKIAIARAIYKDSPLLILDEPTAGLDAKAESEIYEDFFNLSKGKTAIFISHRLAASVIADNIAVFADGRIKEYGSHSKLMNLNGLYAEMYRKQRRPYVDERNIL